MGVAGIEMGAGGIEMGMDGTEMGVNSLGTTLVVLVAATVR